MLFPIFPSIKIIIYTGILSLTHNASYPTCGFGYSINPGSGLAPRPRYAFTFSPYGAVK